MKVKQLFLFTLITVLLVIGVIGCNNQTNNSESYEDDKPSAPIFLEDDTFNYLEKKDGLYIAGISTKFNSTLEELNIKDSFDGKNIVGIEDNAFELANGIKKIKLDANATGINFVSIGDGAFRNSTIEEFSIPVKSVGSNAFAFCQSLKLFNFDNLESMGESAFSAAGDINNPINDTVKLKTLSKRAFEKSPLLTKVDLSEYKLLEIPESAFKYAQNLSLVILPDVSDESRAITLNRDCFSMTDFYLPRTNNLKEIRNMKSVKYIGSGAFDVLTSSSSIKIDLSYMPYLKTVDSFAFCAVNCILGHIDLTHVTSIAQSDESSFAYFGGGYHNSSFAPNNSITIHMLQNLYDTFGTLDPAESNYPSDKGFLANVSKNIVGIKLETAESTQPFVN